MSRRHRRTVSRRAGLLVVAPLTVLGVLGVSVPAQADFSSGGTDSVPGSSWTTGSAPAAPGSVAVASFDASSSSQTVSWPAVAGATTYRVHVAGTDGSTVDRTVAGTSLTLAVTPGVTYTVSVQATNGFESANRTTTSTPEDRPASLSFTGVKAATVIPTWAASVTGATQYRVQLAANSAFTAGVTTKVVPAGSPQATFTGLVLGRRYWARVQAVNAAGTAFRWTTAAMVVTQLRAHAPAAGYRVLTAGPEYTAVVSTDNRAALWGRNTNGQLGRGGTTDVNPLATLAANLSGQTVVKVAHGVYHTLALTSGGQVWAWGLNDHGQLGDGTTTQRTTPVLVGGFGGRKIVDLGAGWDYSVAVADDGSVWTWGTAEHGMLGQPGAAERHTPGMIPGSTGITAIAAGDWYAIGLNTSGQLWGWGWNNLGQLGLGDANERDAPTQLTAFGNTVAQVSAGEYDALVLTTTNEAWAMGGNYGGQLGNGTTTWSLSPVRVQGLTGIIDRLVAGSGNHSAAITADGALWTWGANESGQLGDGTTSSRLTAHRVGLVGGQAATEVALGDAHTVVTTDDGRLWSAGASQYGQLGSGDTASRASLAPIADPDHQ